jgi:large subunit ribosomal protein L22
MEVKARLKYLRISPKKVRLVANLIKHKTIAEAKSQLMILPQRSKRPILKLLDSAISNAKHNFHLAEENLYIKNITVDPGPSLKRWMPRARGSASPIYRRSSHINLVLEELKNRPQKLKSVFKAEKEVIKEEKPEKKKEMKREIKKVEPKAIKKMAKREEVRVKQKIFRRKAIS